MIKPLVAVVGRPNVGKSTFFNRMAGRRIAIVEDVPGVTRDRLYADAEWLNYSFTIVDTGGLDFESSEVITRQMKEQAEIAVDVADVILFFVDGKEGLVSADEDVASFLRKTKKPVILVVNKIDTPGNDELMYDFYSLGLADVFGISSTHGLGMGELLDKVVESFPKGDGKEDENDDISIAVLGRPNVGKSSLVNALLKSNRSIVSDEPGTTRDAIDTPFEHEGKSYTLIDTAGIRRKSKIEDASVERYSVIRALGALRRCDVCLILVDAVEGITEQDVRIAGYAHEEGKPAIICINKWDLIEKDNHTIEKYKKKIFSHLAFMQYAKLVFISAKTGQRVAKLIDEVQFVFGQSCRRISTGTLNDCLSEAVAVNEPPSDKGRRLKIYYATQVSVRPPTFVIFVNDPNLMHFSYERYLENYLRKTFGFEGTPIRIIIREKTGGENQ